MAHVRSRARSWALNLLYAWDAAGEGPLVAHATDQLELRRMSARYRPHALALLQAVEAHLPEIDRLISDHASNWRFERISAIDRNVLRLGLAEMRWIDDVPPKVAIQEAVRLAGKYGSADSPGFVNGVLDAVYKQASPGG